MSSYHKFLNKRFERITHNEQQHVDLLLKEGIIAARKCMKICCFNFNSFIVVLFEVEGQYQ